MIAILFRGLTEGIRRKKQNRAVDVKENTVRGLLGWGLLILLHSQKGYLGPER